MNEHELLVLKRMRELGPVDANSLLYYLGPADAGRFVLTEVLRELREKGYVETKTFPYKLLTSFFAVNENAPMVITKLGMKVPDPNETYWVVTEQGLAALKALEPPKPQYLGETPIDIATHPVYSKYTPADWALLWITMYSGFDEAHHKDWLIAEVTKILNNTQVIARLAKWSNGQEEERFTLAEPSEQFNAWKMAYEGDVYPDEDGGGTEYEFNEGIPP